MFIPHKFIYFVFKFFTNYFPKVQKFFNWIKLIIYKNISQIPKRLTFFLWNNWKKILKNWKNFIKIDKKNFHLCGTKISFVHYVFCPYFPLWARKAQPFLRTKSLSLGGPTINFNQKNLAKNNQNKGIKCWWTPSNKVLVRKKGKLTN